ncbi:transposase, partial [Hydrogenibacillus schlegelii]|uniref:transposase n=1 Tax=Hydrogenibacillus schlegelii TaxID=1484 RepID=UPI00349FF30F
ALQKEVYKRVRAILDAPDLKTARLLMKEFGEEDAEQAPPAVTVLAEGGADVPAVQVWPARDRRRLRTTNGVARLTEEIRRRDRVIRIFPHRESVIRLIGALLMEIVETWTTWHRFLYIDEYWQWKKEQEKSTEPALLHVVNA